MMTRRVSTNVSTMGIRDLNFSCDKGRSICVSHQHVYTWRHRRSNSDDPERSQPIDKRIRFFIRSANRRHKQKHDSNKKVCTEDKDYICIC